MKIIAIYTPKNDENMPWLAGELSSFASEFNAAEKFGLVNGYLNENSPIPVFYVGDNDNFLSGKYDRKASWFPRSLKGDIAQKKGECYQLNDICINGIPFFIRQNTSGTQYLSNKDDTILLVDKKDGADDGDYTIRQLKRRDNGKYEIPNIGPLHGKFFDLKNDIPFPYYNHLYVQKIYAALQIKLANCTDPNLCKSFTKRKNELPAALIEQQKKKCQCAECNSSAIRRYSPKKENTPQATQAPQTAQVSYPSSLAYERHS